MEGLDGHVQSPFDPPDLHREVRRVNFYQSPLATSLFNLSPTAPVCQQL
jgi:hypothetical protein